MNVPVPALRACAAAVALVLPALALAQAQPPQKVSPPEVQAWIDLATYSGFGVPGMPGLGGAGGEGAGALSMLGSLLGSATGRGGNRFGHTRTGGSAGVWMDVTLSSRRQALNEATLSVPPGSGLAPQLKLQAPKSAPAPRSDDERDTEPVEQERPRGKVSLYWGCGDEVRPGQPRTVDFATTLPQDLAGIFSGRRATQRGAHSAAGRPLWPNEGDARLLPKEASLAGELAFAGAGVPENFRFTLPPQQDLMPALDLKQADAGGATRLNWTALQGARAYFVAAMGARRGDEAHLVLWTSSELPDSGFGLVDYQTNAALERWTREKVLLPAGSSSCTIPRGVFSGEGGAMLKLIAYGNETNLAHPPRPSDPRQPWEPVWAVKLRQKSVASAMLGLDMGAAMAGRPAAEAAEPPPEGERKPGALDRLRGLFGR